MTGMLYLLLILRECTPSDADLILRIKKKSSVIALPFNHMPTMQLPQAAKADLVKLTKGTCFVQFSEHGSLCK